MSQIAALFEDTFTFLWQIINTPIYGFKLYNIIVGCFFIVICVRFVVLPFFGGQGFSVASDMAKKHKQESND